MSSDKDGRLRAVLPLPAFVLHPYTALLIAAVHVYLSYGHLSKLFGGEVKSEHLSKGFGALAGVYIFVALASRGLARRTSLLKDEVAPSTAITELL